MKQREARYTEKKQNASGFEKASRYASAYEVNWEKRNAMETNIMKKLQKEKAKFNPMENSEYCYYQSLGSAAMGFEKAINLRQGDITKVTTKDILDYAEIDPDEFEFVFGDPSGLLHDIYEEIQSVFTDAEKMLEGMDENLQMTNIFKRLRKNAPLLRVLIALCDHSIWRMSLRQIVARLATDWPPDESPEWKYLYENYCCQFASILEKWETSDFAESHVEDCVRLAHIWMEADGMLGDTVEGLLGSWEEEK